MSTTTDHPKSDRTFASLPLKPLWDLARAKADMPEVAAQVSATLGFTSTMFADMIGHHPKAVGRWQEVGAIPWLSADVAAVKLGYHPVEVWGDGWLNVKGDLADIVAGKFDAAIERALAEAEAAMTAEMTAEVMAD